MGGWCFPGTIQSNTQVLMNFISILCLTLLISSGLDHAYPHVDKQELLQRKQHAWLSARADRGVFVGVHDGERVLCFCLAATYAFA